MTVSWHKLGHVNAGEILIVECNYNVFSGDPAACDETPSNLDMPGGPWYPSIIVANLGTEAPIAGPIPFGLTP